MLPINLQQGQLSSPIIFGTQLEDFSQSDAPSRGKSSSHYFGALGKQLGELHKNSSGVEGKTQANNSTTLLSDVSVVGKSGQPMPNLNISTLNDISPRNQLSVDQTPFLSSIERTELSANIQQDLFAKKRANSDFGQMSLRAFNGNHRQEISALTGINTSNFDLNASDCSGNPYRKLLDQQYSVRSTVRGNTNQSELIQPYNSRANDYNSRGLTPQNYSPNTHRLDAEFGKIPRNFSTEPNENHSQWNWTSSQMTTTPGVSYRNNRSSSYADNLQKENREPYRKEQNGRLNPEQRGNVFERMKSMFVTPLQQIGSPNEPQLGSHLDHSKDSIQRQRNSENDSLEHSARRGRNLKKEEIKSTADRIKSNVTEEVNRLITYYRSRSRSASKSSERGVSPLSSHREVPGYQNKKIEAFINGGQIKEEEGSATDTSRFQTDRAEADKKTPVDSLEGITTNHPELQFTPTLGVSGGIRESAEFPKNCPSIEPFSGVLGQTIKVNDIISGGQRDLDGKKLFKDLHAERVAQMKIPELDSCTSLNSARMRGSQKELTARTVGSREGRESTKTPLKQLRNTTSNEEFKTPLHDNSFDYAQMFQTERSNQGTEQGHEAVEYKEGKSQISSRKGDESSSLCLAPTANKEEEEACDQLELDTKNISVINEATANNEQVSLECKGKSAERADSRQHNENSQEKRQDIGQEKAEKQEKAVVNDANGHTSKNETAGRVSNEPVQVKAFEKAKLETRIQKIDFKAVTNSSISSSQNQQGMHSRASTLQQSSNIFPDISQELEKYKPKRAERALRASRQEETVFEEKRQQDIEATHSVGILENQEQEKHEEEPQPVLLVNPAVISLNHQNRKEEVTLQSNKDESSSDKENLNETINNNQLLPEKNARNSAKNPVFPQEDSLGPSSDPNHIRLEDELESIPSIDDSIVLKQLQAEYSNQMQSNQNSSLISDPSSKELASFVQNCQDDSKSTIKVHAVRRKVEISEFIDYTSSVPRTTNIQYVPQQILNTTTTVAAEIYKLPEIDATTTWQYSASEYQVDTKAQESKIMPEINSNLPPVSNEWAEFIDSRLKVLKESLVQGIVQGLQTTYNPRLLSPNDKGTLYLRENQQYLQQGTVRTSDEVALRKNISGRDSDGLKSK